jgi:hypothetical protein
VTPAGRFVAFLGMLVLAVSGAGLKVQANGAEFFEAENDGKVVLYYFGSVKDSKGAVLDKVMVTVTAKNANLTFPFRNDSPGHFRSPDVGKSIQGAGKTVDPAQIEITVSKPGYKIVKAPKIPNKMGAVQLDTFILDPVSAAAGK